MAVAYICSPVLVRAAGSLALACLFVANLRLTYGTIPIGLRMNTFCFKKIDGPAAKFLGKQV